MTNDKPNNPQAFPYFHTHQEGHIVGKEGMTLRDYFAGQALIKLCDFYSSSFDPEWIEKEYQQTAKRCYEIADAMLAERSK